MGLKVGLFDRIFLGRTDPEDDKNGDIEEAVAESPIYRKILLSDDEEE